MLNFSEKFRIIAKRKNLKMGDMAEALGFTRQNLNYRLKNNTWTEAELRRIASVIGCTVEIVLTDTETGETL